MEYSKESLLEQNKTFSKDDFIFFGPSSEDSETACLSMMFPVRFVMRSCLFGSAEQGLMAEKAFMFSDQVALNKILDENNPITARNLGRRIVNYNEYVWQRNCQKRAAMVNYHKFRYNDDMRNFLLATGDKIIVEANSKDRLWGIGLDTSSPYIIDPKRWKGSNKAGFALMMARDMLRGNYKEKELSPFQITKLVTNNLSSINKLLNGEDPKPKKKVVATSKTWKTSPLSEYITTHQNFLITEEQMSVLRFGHIPDAMEDHWFMYADDYSINYFRSWTGICIFQAFYHKTNHGYVINELRVNCNKEEYLEVDIHRSVALFYALLLDDFDGYSQPYWNAYMW